MTTTVRRRRADSTKGPIDLAAEQVAELVRHLLATDQALAAEVAKTEIARQVAAGALIDTRQLKVGVFQMVPTSQLTHMREELDLFRVAVAEHLDGNDRTELLRDLVESDPTEQAVIVGDPDDDVIEPETGSEQVVGEVGEEPDQVVGEVGEESGPDDEARRPSGLPDDDGPCEWGEDDTDDGDPCTEIVPVEQGQLSWTLCRRRLCRGHHQVIIDRRRARPRGDTTSPEE